MKIEYIFVKSLDEYCTSKEQFCNFLCSNKHIRLKKLGEEVSEKQILLLDEYELEYRLEYILIEKSQECGFHLLIEIAENGDEQADILELFDITVREINIKNGNQFSINTIWNDASAYYGKKLYPEIIKIEGMLRKIIYLFMLKTAGSRWFNESTPEKFKVSIESVIEKNNKPINEINSDWLTYADFITLIYFFTAPYSLKSNIKELFEELELYITEDKLQNKNENNDKKALTAEIVNKLSDEFKPKNNWERYFSDKLTIKSQKKFSEDWSSLYNIRNKVAHGKPIHKEDYNKAICLIEKYCGAFDECISIIDTLEITSEEAKAVEDIAQQVISKEPKEILGNGGISDYNNQIRLDGAYAGIKILNERISEIGSSLNKDSTLQVGKTIADSLYPVASNVGILSGIKGLEQVTSQLQTHNELALNKEGRFRITDQVPNVLEPTITQDTWISKLGENIHLGKITAALDVPLRIDEPILNVELDKSGKLLVMQKSYGIQSEIIEKETETSDE